MRLHVPEPLGVVVRHPPDTGTRSRWKLGERQVIGDFHIAGPGGDRGAVGVVARVLERGRHPVDQLVGGCVLEAFGLLVHHVPGIAETPGQVGLEDPVPADDPECLAGSGSAQPDAPVAQVAQRIRTRRAA